MKNNLLKFKKCALLIVCGLFFFQWSSAQFTPGEGGTIPAFTPFTNLPNKIPGFRVQKSHQENIFWGNGATRPVVELNFPLPSEFGATSYTLQYSTNAGVNWNNLKYDGTNDLTTTGDNFSLNLDQNYKLRLLVNGGPKNGYTSNEVFVELSGVATRFAGWSIDQGMFITGVMSPFIGCGIDVSFTVRKLVDDTPVTGFLTYQWYRVNPATYEMTPIAGATNLRYITTPADAGYMLAIRATSDGVNVGGYCQLMVMSRNINPNNTYSSNVSNTGFTINLFKSVSNFTSNDFVLYDKDQNVVPVTSVTQGQNAAIYNVVAALDVSKSPYNMQSRSTSWSMVSLMGPPQMQHMMENVVIAFATGLQNVEGALNVFPSPAKNELNFKNHETVNEAVILNLNGQILSRNFINNPQGNLNTSALSNGIYFLKLISDNGKTTLRKFQILK